LPRDASKNETKNFLCWELVSKNSIFSNQIKAWIDDPGFFFKEYIELINPNIPYSS
jgi:hypothetical protein